MKKLLFILLLFISGASFAQVSSVTPQFKGGNGVNYLPYTWTGKTSPDSLGNLKYFRANYLQLKNFIDSLNAHSSFFSNDFIGLGTSTSPIRLSIDTIGLGGFIVRGTTGLRKDTNHYVSTSSTLFEKVANKATTFGTLNNTLYPTTQAVANYVAASAPVISLTNGLTLTGGVGKLGSSTPLSAFTQIQIGTNTFLVQGNSATFLQMQSGNSTDLQGGDGTTGYAGVTFAHDTLLLFNNNGSGAKAQDISMSFANGMIVRDDLNHGLFYLKEPNYYAGRQIIDAFKVDSLITAHGGGVSLTTTGTSGAATLVSGVLNIPVYAGTTYSAGYGMNLTGTVFKADSTLQGSKLWSFAAFNTKAQDASTYTPQSRTLTINGATLDLSANRSWTITAGATPVANEVPSGSINTSNVTYTLAHTPASGSVSFYLNGLNETHFTMSGGTATFSFAPHTGDSLTANYSY